MDPKHHDNQAAEKKLSEQFSEFIDLTDGDLEEVTVLEFGGAIDGVHGGQCGGCGGCGHRCGCGHRRCGCGHRRCGCGHRRCGCGNCGGCGGGCCW